MTAGKRGSQTSLWLLILFFIGLGSEASIDTQNNTILRQSRQSSQCSPYNEVGSVCSSVLGNGSTVTFQFGRNRIADTDSNILDLLGIPQLLPFPDSRCQQLYLAIFCMTLNIPCDTNVWCTNASRAEIEAMVNESCTCSEPFHQSCTGLQELLRRQLPSNLYQTGQDPAQAQCTNINIDDIVVPTSPPPTTPPLPGVPCQPYDGGVCSDVLGSQNVRVINYTETEIQLEATLVQARQVGGGNLTGDCEKSLLYIICAIAYTPCAGNVWCSPNGAAGLVAKLYNSCTCPEPASTQCEQGKGVVFSQAQRLESAGYLFDTEGVPSNQKCQILTQDSAAFTTSQAYVYTVFTAALMIIVGMVV